MNENIFDKLDFGPFRALLDDDDITDISYDNNGQIWIRSLTKGSLRVEIEGATPEFVEKLAFQCSNVMGTTFNNAKPFLDAESAELRLNFVHQSIATNGIALVIRKTPAKIRLEKEKLLSEDYFTESIHDFLIKCVQGHCNIMVAGETGSGKTEFVKYLASHTITSEKIITIEDTLELHLDKIYPQRDIVSMKTNNVASYSDVLVTCMRQNPKWILLSEVRSAEAVSAVRNSISSGHNILSTIHADKASAIPYRLYSLMETDLDVHQFLTTIYRYIQLGVHIKAFYSKEYGKFHRELDEVCEFYVDDNNEPQSHVIYRKQMGQMMMCKPSKHLIEYIENQNIDVSSIIKDLPDELPVYEGRKVIDAVENVYDENNPKPVMEWDVEAKDGEVKDNADEQQITADLGHAETVPIVSDSGDIKLSDTVVQSESNVDVPALGGEDGSSSDIQQAAPVIPVEATPEAPIISTTAPQDVPVLPGSVEVVAQPVQQPIQQQVSQPQQVQMQPVQQQPMMQQQMMTQVAPTVNMAAMPTMPTNMPSLNTVNAGTPVVNVPTNGVVAPNQMQVSVPTVGSGAVGVNSTMQTIVPNAIKLDG